MGKLRKQVNIPAMTFMDSSRVNFPSVGIFYIRISAANIFNNNHAG